MGVGEWVSGNYYHFLKMWVPVCFKKKKPQKFHPKLEFLYLSQFLSDILTGPCFHE